MPTKKYLLTPVDVLDKVVHFIEGRYLVEKEKGKKWDYTSKLQDVALKRMGGKIPPFHKAR
jgi:hypothetical protein